MSEEVSVIKAEQALSHKISSLVKSKQLNLLECFLNRVVMAVEEASAQPPKGLSKTELIIIIYKNLGIIYKDVFGKKPTVSLNSSFSAFCELTVPLFDLQVETHGFIARHWKEIQNDSHELRGHQLQKVPYDH